MAKNYKQIIMCLEFYEKYHDTLAKKIYECVQDTNKSQIIFKIVLDNGIGSFGVSRMFSNEGIEIIREQIKDVFKVNQKDHPRHYCMVSQVGISWEWVCENKSDGIKFKTEILYNARIARNILW